MFSFFSKPVIPPTPPSLPAACADCIETTIPSIPGANPLEMIIRQFRSLEGKLRFDFGMMSLIINPLTGVQFLLDHLAMEARMLEAMVQLPGMPQLPPIPSIPSLVLPQAPNIGAEIASLEQLGISIIQGLEAEGMRYLFPPGGLIFSWEIWTSIQLRIPVLTRTIGAFGERTCICNCTGVQPPAATFEIPPGYKVIPPPVPAVPTVSAPVPNVSASVTLPPTPNLPATPNIPSAPTLPPTPNIPPTPTLPPTPGVPSTPTIPPLPRIK